MEKFNFEELDKYVSTSCFCKEKHPFANLSIYGYYNENLERIEWNDVNKFCRGIILDGKGFVQELPFVKFWAFKQYLSKDLILLDEDHYPNKNKIQILSYNYIINSYYILCQF